MSKRKTKEEWQSDSNEIHNNEFEIIGNPKNALDKVDILHKKCGNIINVTPHNHLRRYCIYCSNKNKKTKEECQRISNEIHNNEFIILDSPKNIKTNVRIKHIKCGSIIKMTINNHINHKNGCKYCSKNSLKSNKYWVNKCYEIWGGEFKIIDEVTNVWEKVKVKHSICGNILLKDMNNLIHSKRGCNICTSKSYGEIYIKEFFDVNNIKYITQKHLMV